MQLHSHASFGVECVSLKCRDLKVFHEFWETPCHILMHLAPSNSPICRVPPAELHQFTGCFSRLKSGSLLLLEAVYIFKNKHIYAALGLSESIMQSCDVNLFYVHIFTVWNLHLMKFTKEFESNGCGFFFYPLADLRRGLLNSKEKGTGIHSKCRLLLKCCFYRNSM